MNDKNLVEITDVYEIAEILREEIQVHAQDVKELMNNNHHKAHADLGEVKANIMLAYRHLEDARMRLGKVIQAEDGSVSIYDAGLHQVK